MPTLGALEQHYELSFSHAFVLAEGPGAMLGSAVIGGFILAMIEGTGILINRYSQMLMPQPGMEGMQTFFESSARPNHCSVLEPLDLDKGKIDLNPPPFFTSPTGPSSSAPSHYS